jgi:hypothetical protein
MSDEPTPNDEFVVERSLSAALIQAAEVVGSGAAAGVTGALTSHWLEGNSDKPAEPETPQIELPPGVNLDD